MATEGFKRLSRWLLPGRHDRRFWRKHALMFREADVLVIAHTKSGQTWLRAMLSHLFHLRYGVPADELIHFDNLQRREPAIPKFYVTRDTSLERHARAAGDFRIAPHQKVIFLVRDPRDTAVSFFFHVQHRATPRELARKEIPEDARRLSISEFVAHPDYGVPRVIRFLNRWRIEAAALQHARVLRYEDLLARPEAELLRLASFLELDVDEAQIAAAVRFAAFDNLQRLEREGFFRSDRLGAKDAGDANTYKVREGRVGGYRQHLTSEQVQAIDRTVEDELHPAFAYGGARRESGADLGD
jgi:hypothetical protein